MAQSVAARGRQLGNTQQTHPEEQLLIQLPNDHFHSNYCGDVRILSQTVSERVAVSTSGHHTRSTRFAWYVLGHKHIVSRTQSF